MHRGKRAVVHVVKKRYTRERERERERKRKSWSQSRLSLMVASPSENYMSECLVLDSLLIC